MVVSLNGRALGSLSKLATGVTMRSDGQPVMLEVVRGTQRLRVAVPVVEQRDSLDRLLGSVDRETNLVRRFQPGDPVVLQIERQGRLTFLAFRELLTSRRALPEVGPDR